MGVKLTNDVIQQVSELEEMFIKDEILPALSKNLAPRLEPIKRDLVLVVEYHPGEPISVALSRKTNITALINAKRLETDSEVEHKVIGPHKVKRTNIASRTGLCVIRKDGTVLQEHDAASTFTSAIIEAGLHKVRALGLMFSHVNIVSTTDAPKNGRVPRQVAPGLFVHTHSSTMDKKKMLDRINEALNMGWTVEIIE